MKYRMQIVNICDTIKIVNVPEQMVATICDPYMMPHSGGAQFISLKTDSPAKVGDWVELDYTDGKGRTWTLIESKNE